MEGQHLDEAVKSFEHAVKLNAALPEAHEILGQALLALKRTEEARTHLNEALRLRPDYAEAHHDLGRLCVEEGLLAEAANHYRHALALKPEPDTQTNLIFCSITCPKPNRTDILRSIGAGRNGSSGRCVPPGGPI